MASNLRDCVKISSNKVKDTRYIFLKIDSTSHNKDESILADYAIIKMEFTFEGNA